MLEGRKYEILLVLCSENSGLKSLSEDWTSTFRICVFFLTWSSKIPGLYPQLVYERFLPHPFQYTNRK